MINFPAWDTDLFLFLNGLNSPFIDELMRPWITDMYIFVPFFAFALYLFYKQLGWQVFLFAIIGIALCILLADRISSGFFKPFFERCRPSHNPALEGLVHTVGGKLGGRYGFVSSHAANVFAVGFYAMLLLRRKWFSITMLSVALIISYSRVYVGVHYPLDVICGGLFGAICGTTVYYLHRWVVQKWLAPKYKIRQNTVCRK